MYCSVFQAITTAMMPAMEPTMVPTMVTWSPDKPPPPLPLVGREDEVEVDVGNDGVPTLPGVATRFGQYASPCTGDQRDIPRAVPLPTKVVVELGLAFSTAPMSTPH